MSGLDEAFAYLRQARADLETATLIMGNQPDRIDAILVALQHSCEKAVKASHKVMNLSAPHCHRVTNLVGDLQTSILPSIFRFQFWRQLLDEIRKNNAVRLCDSLLPSQDNDKPNSEYPWKVQGRWTSPCDSLVLPVAVGIVINDIRSFVDKFDFEVRTAVLASGLKI